MSPVQGISRNCSRAVASKDQTGLGVMIRKDRLRGRKEDFKLRIILANDIAALGVESLFKAPVHDLPCHGLRPQQFLARTTVVVGTSTSSSSLVITQRQSFIDRF